VAASIAVAAIVAEEPASSMFMGMITKQTPKKGERFTPEDGMVIHANPAKYGECAGGPISPAAVSRSNSMRKDVSSRTGRLTTSLRQSQARTCGSLDPLNEVCSGFDRAGVVD
jgi:hypothetical protein